MMEHHERKRTFVFGSIVVIGLLTALAYNVSHPDGDDLIPLESLKPHPENTQKEAEALPRPPLLDKMLKEGVSLVGSFPAGDQLRGWVIESDGRRNIVYSSPNNAMLIAGALLGPNGENFSVEHMEEWKAAGYGESGAEPENAGDWASLEDSSWFETGEGENVVYALYEPHCGYCANLVGMSRDVNLRFRWIPVAFLAQDSLSIAGHFLEAESPSKALFDWTAARSTGRTQLYTKDIAPISPESMAKIESNVSVMRDFNIQGTPALIFLNDKGEAQVVRGQPSAQMLDALAGA